MFDRLGRCGDAPARRLRRATPARPAVLKHLYSGKVRELYETGDGVLLLVATDRISAFDYVLATPIPDKGKILTQLSLWWFERLADVVPNHLVHGADPGRVRRPRDGLPAAVDGAGGVRRPRLPGRVGAGRLPADRRGVRRRAAARARRRLAAARAGLHPGDQGAARASTTRTSRPPRWPAWSAPDVAAELERITLEVYRRGAELAAGRGIIVADTKIELGFDAAGRLLLADEVLTPDSSRFWPADRWRPGRSQPSFDKQYVRDWLTHRSPAGTAGGAEPPPPLPDRVVERTRRLTSRHTSASRVTDGPRARTSERGRNGHVAGSRGVTGAL